MWFVFLLKTVSTDPVKYECTPLEEKGNKCQNHEDCKLGLGCAGVDPTCIELFSLNDGDKSTVASLCKSNHIYTDSTLGSICVSSSIKDGKCNDAHTVERRKKEMKHVVKIIMVKIHVHFNLILNSIRSTMKHFKRR